MTEVRRLTPVEELADAYTPEPPPLEAYPPPTSRDSSDRTPPHDRDAEAAVLGSCLRDKNAIADVWDTLAPNDFYDPKHELIFDAITTAYARLEPVDPITITDRLAKTGQLNRCGGPAYLHHLHGSVTVTTNAGYYADIVAERAGRRRLVEAGTRIVQMGYANGDGTVTDLREHATSYLANVVRVVPGVDSTTGERFLDFTDLYTTPPQPIPWLIAPILAAGRVTLLYAPGKAGKSLIAMEAACALATGGLALTQRIPHHPVHVLYVDQEQTPDDWRDRTQDMGYTLDDAATLTEHLHVSNLQSWAPLDTPAGGAQLLAEVHRTNARVVIIDTVSKIVGGEENSNDTHQALYRHTLAALKREGLAVLMLDHTGKDLEKGARGGSAKTDNIDIAYQLTPRGHDKLTLAPTHVRFRDDATSRTLSLIRSTTPRLAHVEDTWENSTDPATEFRPTRFMEKISRLVETTPSLSKAEVLDLITGRNEYKRKALATLIAEGYIEDSRGLHNKALLAELKPYREASDPMASERTETDQDGTP